MSPGQRTCALLADVDFTPICQLLWNNPQHKVLNWCCLATVDGCGMGGALSALQHCYLYASTILTRNQTICGANSH